MTGIDRSGASRPARGVACALALLAAAGANALLVPAVRAEPSVPAASASARVAVDAPPATLVYWNRQVVVFRATLGSESPALRAEAARARLEILPERVLAEGVAGHPGRLDDDEVYLVTVGAQPVFRIVPEDLPELASGLAAEGELAVAKLREALAAREEQADLPRLLRGAAEAAAATGLALFLIVAGARLRKRWVARVAERSARRAEDAGAGSEIVASLVKLARGAGRALGWALRAIVAYAWAVFVLTRFPFSRPWGERLGGWIAGTLASAAHSVLAALPDLATVVLILVGARLASRLLSIFLERVESGVVTVSLIPPEVANVTRRIAIGAIWMIAIALAYPFIPGSSSLAFQGLSVLVGVMVTLGSAGLVNHVLAGWVILFSRSMRVGEYVRIGDEEGRVAVLGVLSTRIITPKNLEVVIPNGVVTAAKMVNYSRRAGPEATWAIVTVTIGYDAPWRQVEAMLLEAAAATDGVRAEPGPTVQQRELSDFYVEYDLVVEVEIEGRARILSALRSAIQDRFNENGVQILSPHFLAQPDEPVVVPRSRWFAAPAREPRRPKDEPGRS